MILLMMILFIVALQLLCRHESNIVIALFVLVCSLLSSLEDPATQEVSPADLCVLNSLYNISSWRQLIDGDKQQIITGSC